MSFPPPTAGTSPSTFPKDAFTNRVSLGIIVGLVVVKTLGVSTATALAVKLRLGRLPRGVGARQLLGAAALAGIGFTVSLFIADLSFGGTARLAEAKVAILLASLMSGVLGLLVLFRDETSGHVRCPRGEEGPNG